MATKKKKTTQKSSKKKTTTKKVGTKKSSAKKVTAAQKTTKKKSAAAKKSSVKKTASKKASTKKSVSKKAKTKATAKKTTSVSKAKASIKTKASQVTSKTKVAKAKKPAKVASVVSKTTLKVGDRVPSFTAVATKGSVSLESLKGKKVVIYFYPKDHTPGCTIEGHDFSKALPEFAAHNTVVFGVSRDSLSSHESFIEKQCYSIDLISDPEEKLCHLFGVMKEKSLYGRKYIGVDRSTFLIDEQGVITHVWQNVKVPGHVDEVLKAVKG